MTTKLMDFLSNLMLVVLLVGLLILPIGSLGLLGISSQDVLSAQDIMEQDVLESTSSINYPRVQDR